MRQIQFDFVAAHQDDMCSVVLWPCCGSTPHLECFRIEGNFTSQVPFWKCICNLRIKVPESFI
ncbi:unnamed protein product [Rhodiola kirilowii]